MPSISAVHKITNCLRNYKSPVTNRVVPRLASTAAGISITIKVHPRAKKNAITGTTEDAYKLSLTAPPVDGKANEAVIHFFADVLDIPRSSVTIISGATSRTKVIRVTGVSAEKVAQALDANL